MFNVTNTAAKSALVLPMYKHCCVVLLFLYMAIIIFSYSHFPRMTLEIDGFLKTTNPNRNSWPRECTRESLGSG